MEKLEKLAAETKFSVYSRRVTLVVTGAATILIICVLSLFAAVVVLKLHTCSGGLSPSSPQALKDAKKVICLEPGCLAAAEDAVECKLLSLADPREGSARDGSRCPASADGAAVWEILDPPLTVCVTNYKLQHCCGIII